MSCVGGDDRKNVYTKYHHEDVLMVNMDCVGFVGVKMLVLLFDTNPDTHSLGGDVCDNKAITYKNPTTPTATYVISLLRS